MFECTVHFCSPSAQKNSLKKCMQTCINENINISKSVRKVDARIRRKIFTICYKNTYRFDLSLRILVNDIFDIFYIYHTHIQNVTIV